MTAAEFLELDFNGRIAVLEAAVCIGSRETADSTVLLYQHPAFYLEVYQHKRYRYIFGIEVCTADRLRQYPEKKPLSAAFLLNLTYLYEAFERQCRQLVGEVLEGVDYTEAAYCPADPAPNYTTACRGLHTVDFSVGITTRRGRRFAIGWQTVRFLYGGPSVAYRLGVAPDAGTEVPRGQQRWAVSGAAPWAGLVGQRISDVHVFWEQVAVGRGPRERMDYHYPQAVAVVLANGGAVYIGAAELKGKQGTRAERGADNLLVTADPKLVLQSGMLPLGYTYQVQSRRVGAGLGV